MKSMKQLFTKETIGPITYQNIHCWPSLHHIFVIDFLYMVPYKCVRLMDRILRNFHHRSNDFRPTMAKFISILEFFCKVQEDATRWSTSNIIIILLSTIDVCNATANMLLAHTSPLHR